MLALSVLVLMRYEVLALALEAVIALFRNEHSHKEMLGNHSLTGAVRTIFPFLLPFYAVMLIASRVSVQGLLWTLAGIVMFCLLRLALGRLLGWLTREPELFRELGITEQVAVIGVMVFSIPGALVGWIWPATPLWVTWTWMGLAAAAGFSIYARRGFSLIFERGFSLFYWILYLCVLEILPICVVVNLLMHGN